MKLDKSGRHKAFWIVCIPFRLAYASLALVLGHNSLRILLCIQAAVATLQIVGFLSSLRKTVGGFGGPAWWAKMRPIHIGLYVCFAASVALGVWWAGVFLLADAVVGAVSWLTVRPLFFAAQRRVPLAGDLPNLTGLSSHSGGGSAA